MFPARFFNPRYWAERYFPKTGASPVVDPRLADITTWNQADSSGTWSVVTTVLTTYGD